MKPLPRPGTPVPPDAARCILFDLDGVLVDTRPMVASALRDTALTLGLEPLPTESECMVAATLSPRRAVREIFPTSAGAGAVFRSNARRRARMLCPCLGIEDLLAAIAAEPLGVVTSRNRAEAGLYLDASGLADYFPVVITWGDTARHKPDPCPLLEAAKRLDANRGLYVGDTVDDMRAAVAADFYPVGATWAGQSSRDALLQAGAKYVAAHPLDVCAAIVG